MKQQPRSLLTLEEIDAYLIQQEEKRINEQIQDTQLIDRNLYIKDYQNQLEAMHPLEKLELYNEEHLNEIETYIFESRFYLDKFRFFNMPNALANIDHYLSLVTWTREEATALCFGKNPEIVNFDTLNTYIHGNTNDPKAIYSAFINSYFNVRSMLLSDPLMADRIPPINFLNWFNKNKIIAYEKLRERAIKREIVLASEYRWIHDEIESVINEDIEFIDKIYTSKPITNKDTSKSEIKKINTCLRVVAAMLEFIEGTTEGIQPHPQFKNLTAFVDLMEEKYYSNDVKGLSRRNLMRLFSAARMKLKY